MMNDKKCIKMYQTKLGYFKEAKYRGIANEILYYFEKDRFRIFTVLTIFLFAQLLIC